jgi:peptidoglycan/LPS O-acetylase OafA/YrhL
MALFAVSVIPVFALAFASWRLVERPALRFKP